MKLSLLDVSEDKTLSYSSPAKHTIVVRVWHAMSRDEYYCSINWHLDCIGYAHFAHLSAPQIENAISDFLGESEEHFAHLNIETANSFDSGRYAYAHIIVEGLA